MSSSEEGGIVTRTAGDASIVAETTGAVAGVVGGSVDGAACMADSRDTSPQPETRARIRHTAADRTPLGRRRAAFSSRSFCTLLVATTPRRIAHRCPRYDGPTIV